MIKKSRLISLGLSVGAVIISSVAIGSACLNQNEVIPTNAESVWDGSTVTAPSSVSINVDGTKYTPIYTAAEFCWIGSDSSRFGTNYILMNDINLNNNQMQGKMIGNVNNSYTGVFNGNGHIIKNFYHTYSVNLNIATMYFGLFGRLSGTVKNLTIDYGSNTSSYTWKSSSNKYVAGFVGFLDGGTISRCAMLNYKVTAYGGSGTRTSGLTAHNSNGSVDHTYFSATLTMKKYATNPYIGALCIDAPPTIYLCYQNYSVSGDYRSDAGKDAITGTASVASAAINNAVGSTVMNSDASIVHAAEMQAIEWTYTFLQIDCCDASVIASYNFWLSEYNTNYAKSSSVLTTAYIEGHSNSFYNNHSAYEKITFLELQHERSINGLAISIQNEEMMRNNDTAIITIITISITVATVGLYFIIRKRNRSNI